MKVKEVLETVLAIISVCLLLYGVGMAAFQIYNRYTGKVLVSAPLSFSIVASSAIVGVGLVIVFAVFYIVDHVL